MPALSAANPASESAMLTTVARIITTRDERRQETALTPAYFIKFCSTDAMSRMITKTAAPRSVAHSAPQKPPCGSTDEGGHIDGQRAGWIPTRQ